MIFELCRWSEEYREPFAEMQSDADVMADLGGPFGRSASSIKFDRYRDAWTTDGISRWAVIDHAGGFCGYAGVMKCDVTDHPLGSHYEVGWRFRRDAWGRGLATEATRRALSHAWAVLNTAEIFSYTAADNQRSQMVMRRLELKRDTTRDFTAMYPTGNWMGLVWLAERPVSGEAQENVVPTSVNET